VFRIENLGVGWAARDRALPILGLHPQTSVGLALCYKRGCPSAINQLKQAKVATIYTFNTNTRNLAPVSKGLLIYFIRTVQRSMPWM